MRLFTCLEAARWTTVSLVGTYAIACLFLSKYAIACGSLR
jgi:hypothetical protein